MTGATVSATDVTLSATADGVHLSISTSGLSIGIGKFVRSDDGPYAVGDSVWGGARVTEVADVDQIIAQLEIKENDMSRVSEGQKVKFVLDAYPDLEFTGHIQSLSKVVRTKSKNQPSKILDAVVEIDDLDLEIMRPGMSIKATIIAEAS